MKQPQESSKWAQAPAFVDFVWFVFLGTRSLVDLVAGPRCVQWCRNYGFPNEPCCPFILFYGPSLTASGQSPQTDSKAGKKINQYLVKHTYYCCALCGGSCTWRADATYGLDISDHCSKRKLSDQVWASHCLIFASTLTVIRSDRIYI